MVVRLCTASVNESATRYGNVACFPVTLASLVFIISVSLFSCVSYVCFESTQVKFRRPLMISMVQSAMLLRQMKPCTVLCLTAKYRSQSMLCLHTVSLSFSSSSSGGVPTKRA